MKTSNCRILASLLKSEDYMNIIWKICQVPVNVIFQIFYEKLNLNVLSHHVYAAALLKFQIGFNSSDRSPRPLLLRGI